MLRKDSCLKNDLLFFYFLNQEHAETITLLLF